MTGMLPDPTNRPARLVAETRISARTGLANIVGLCSRTLRSELGAALAGTLRKYNEHAHHHPAGDDTDHAKARRCLARALRRALNGWVAATISHRERQASLFALRQLDDVKPDSTRLYRGPIDDVLDRISELRKRRRLKQP